MTTQDAKTPDGQLPGRRQRKALAVRQALFDAGLAAFERQPIALVSVLDITETADVAKGVFYLQFRSKDAYLLALWADVQERFLESARAAVSGKRSRAARTDAVVRALFEFERRVPAATRFWVRMLSYFQDEIGAPGQIAQLRSTYLRQLALLLSTSPGEKPGSEDIAIARLVDTLGWAAVAASVQQGEAVIDADRLLRMLRTVTTKRGS